MRRRIREWLSIALIALAALFAAAWVLSLFRTHAMNVYTLVSTSSPAAGYRSPLRVIGSARGRLWFHYTRAERVEAWAQYDRQLRVEYQSRSPGEAFPHDGPLWLEQLGINWQGSEYSYADPRHGLYVNRQLFFAVPYWLLTTLFGGFGWWLGRTPRRMRRRINRGLCPACGYDVRATPQRCPECGYEAPSPAESAHAR